MALTITKVPDAKAFLGPSQFEEVFQIQPGTSDYPTGGYAITADELGLGSLYGGWTVGRNAAAALFEAKVVLPAGSFGANPQPASSINLEVTVADVQQGANTNLASCTWFIAFRAVNP